MARIDVPAQNIVQSICQLSAIQKFEKAGPIRLDNSESTFTLPYNPVSEGKTTKKGNYRIHRQEQEGYTQQYAHFERVRFRIRMNSG